MNATDFEFRHQTLLDLLVVGAALSAYVVYPDDIVWALVRNHSDSSLLERIAFGSGTIVALGSALLQTCATALSRNRAAFALLLARIFMALALGILLPLAGTITLLIGEAVLIIRLVRRSQVQEDSSAPSGLQSATFKWGLAFSLLLFTTTLQDRIAEVGATASFIVWGALNIRRAVQVNEST